MRSTNLFKQKSGALAALVGASVLVLGLSTNVSAQAASAATADGLAVQPMQLVHSGDERARGARGHYGHKAGHGNHRMMKMFRGLDLTEAQRDQLFTIRHANAPAMRELMKKRRAVRQAMRELISGEQFDQNKVDEVASQIGQVAAEMAAARAKMMFELRAVLTDDQRAKLKERQERRHKKHGRS